MTDEFEETHLGQETSTSSVLPWTPPDLSALRAIDTLGDVSESPSTSPTLRARTSTTSAELIHIAPSKSDERVNLDASIELDYHVPSEHEIRGTGSIHLDEKAVDLSIAPRTKNMQKCVVSKHREIVVMGRLDLSVVTTSSASSDDVEFDLVDAVVLGKDGEFQNLGLLPDSGATKNILPLGTVLALGWTEEDVTPVEKKCFWSLSEKGCWPLGKIAMVFETLDEVCKEHKAKFYVVPDKAFHSYDGLLSVKFCKRKGVLVRQKA